MKKSVISILICLTILSTMANAQTRRRAPQRKPPATKPAPKPSAEMLAGRQRVAGQIKVLTQFLYLFGGITKGIEATDVAARSGEASPTAIEQNEKNKVKIRESIRNVRVGLDELEAEFRNKPSLRTYYPRLSGVALTGEAAETQAAANRFAEAGRLLLKAVGQLADGLAGMQ